METSTVTTRRHVSIILVLCLVASLLAFAFVVMRGNKPARVSSRDIPLPFGSRSTTLRGQLLDIGSTSDDRLITDMTFDDGKASETFGTNSITFVVTPSDASSFSANAPFPIAFTPGTRFYGYKYMSVDGKEERDARDYKLTEPKDAEGKLIAFTFSDLFPGTFFASDDDLADDQSFPSVFAGEEGVTFRPLSELTLEANARYVIIAEEPSAPDSPISNTTLTVRGLTWCGDGTPQAGNNEQCDNGANNGKVCDPAYGSTCTYCTASCQNEIVSAGACGDGVMEVPEICDDGNRVNGDGCSDQCRVEGDYVCFSEEGKSSVCTHNYSWHNATRPLDANSDGTVNTADVQAVTDYINAHPGQSGIDPSVIPVPRYPDVDGNDSITALDVLQIVNWINSQCGNGTPETALGEACDTGAQNGIACTADYAGTCTYCTASCQNETVTGPYCGDSVIDASEVCDDGTNTGSCTAPYGGTCEGCSQGCMSIVRIIGPHCGDGIQQEAGADGIVGTTDDEECDVGVNNGRSSCSTECKVTSPVPFFN